MGMLVQAFLDWLTLLNSSVQALLRTYSHESHSLEVMHFSSVDPQEKLCWYFEIIRIFLILTVPHYWCYCSAISANKVTSSGILCSLMQQAKPGQSKVSVATFVDCWGVILFPVPSVSKLIFCSKSATNCMS